MGILYESYIHPITILSTLPSAGVGAVLFLMLFHIDLSIIALIGVILLIGIVKKNGILMVDFAIQAERNEGKTPEEAIYQASVLRFRPILMTTLAAACGALPLVVSHGTGSELRRPLGVAIVGGLMVSQVLTLYTTPVVYLYFDRMSIWWRRVHGKSTAAKARRRRPRPERKKRYVKGNDEGGLLEFAGGAGAGGWLQFRPQILRPPGGRAAGLQGNQRLENRPAVRRPASRANGGRCSTIPNSTPWKSRSSFPTRTSSPRWRISWPPAPWPSRPAPQFFPTVTADPSVSRTKPSSNGGCRGPDERHSIRLIPCRWTRAGSRICGAASATPSAPAPTPPRPAPHNWKTCA